MEQRVEHCGKTNSKCKSKVITEQSVWRMIHMKVIRSSANVQCASISRKRGKLGPRRSLVNDEVLIQFQCLQVPLDAAWSVHAEP